MLSSPDWHAGVIGIVAARVVEQTGRPTILLSETDGLAKGSGRSIAAFDLLAGVAACSDRLLGYGGHRAACGLSLRADDVAGFAEALAAGDELTLALTDELDLFAPHGLGNPRPLLLLHGAELGACRLTRNGRHLQCDVRLDGVRLLGAVRAAAGGALRRAGRLRQELVQRHGQAPGPGQGRLRGGAARSRPLRDRVRPGLPLPGVG